MGKPANSGSVAAHPLARAGQHLPSMNFFGALRASHLAGLPTPALLLSEEALLHNARRLDQVRRQTQCRMLLALKAFACWPLLPLLRPYLDGVCASGLFEARLGREEFGGQVHSYSPAYGEDELRQLLPLSDHLIFNSLPQWRRLRRLCQPWAGRVSYGLRINPQHRVAAVELYDPSAPGSRLGLRSESLQLRDLEGIDGLHFHNLCEQGLEPLAQTLTVFEQRCRRWLPQLRWVNWGGGHHISTDNYDRQGLIGLIEAFQRRYQVEVILEPGEAVVLNSGLLLARVLDIVASDPPCAILDLSITCHMPDVLEMPYRPQIWAAAEPGVLPHTYQLGGKSCLAGDVAGCYSFATPLQVGQVLIFDDMAHYTSVKMTTFNGVPLPGLWRYRDGELQLLRQFGYQDFKARLG